MNIPYQTHEATPSGAYLTPEANEGEGLLPGPSQIEPYAGIRSVDSPGTQELSESEIGALFGNNRSLVALHWLLASTAVQQATLSALLSAARHRSIRLRGADIPLPKYLRMLSRLCSEVAEQTEAERAGLPAANAAHASQLRAAHNGSQLWEGESKPGSLGNQLIWPGLAEEMETPPALGSLDRYFLPGDKDQRLEPRVLGEKATPYVGGADVLAHMRTDIAAATGSKDFIYLSNWYCDIDLELVPGDHNSTLSSMLFKAAGAGVQVRGMFWPGIDPPSFIEVLKMHPSLFAIGAAGYAAYEMLRALIKKIFDSYASNRAINTATTNYINGLEYLNRIGALPAGDCGAILDNRHRIFGSHHQKLLVLGIGGKLVAYVGGVEPNADRLQAVAGSPGTPLFDTSVRLEGAGAWLALDSFVRRWKAHPDNQPDARPALRGDIPKPTSSGGTLAVQVTTTYGKDYPYPVAVQSASKALANGIKSARQFIYMEDQYFVGSPQMDAAFRAGLSENKALVVVIVLAAEDSVTDTPDIGYRRREFLHHCQCTALGGFWSSNDWETTAH